MSRNKAMPLSDVPHCPAAVTAFYGRFRRKIADIETIAQRNEVLSDMEEKFRDYIRQEPQIREQIKVEFAYFSEGWKFFKEFYEVREDEFYWSSVIAQAGEIMRRYDCPLYKAVVCAIVDELERKRKAIQKAL